MTLKNTEDIFYGKEPNWKHWTPEDFSNYEKVTWSIALAANWYNVRYTERDYRNAVCEYVDRLKIKDGEFIRKLGTDRFEFRSIGAKCRAANRGCVLPEDFQAKVDETITKLIMIGKQISSNTEEENPISIRDRVRKNASILCSELELIIDDYMMYLSGKNSKYKEFQPEEWLKQKQPSAMHCEFIIEFLEPKIKELSDVIGGKNKDLVEGYSHLKKAQIKKFHDFIKLVRDHLIVRQGIAKSNRKPRKKKKKKADQVVKKLKYMIRDQTTGAESILPETIVGCSTLIVYNTKNRKASIYYSDPSKSGITVKGTTLIGYDETLSKEKTIKKINEFIKSAKNDGIRAINNHWKDIKTKETKPNGRINSNVLLLRALK